MKTRPRNRRGITLIEMLVVTAIIALLVSILLPSLTRARRSAMLLKCQTVLREQGVAARLHAGDHEGYMPIAGWLWSMTGNANNNVGISDPDKRHYVYFRESNQAVPVGINGSLAPYLGARVDLESRATAEQSLATDDVRKLFACPSQDNVTGSRSIRMNNWWSPVEYSSYGWNDAAMGRWPGFSSHPAKLRSSRRMGNTHLIAHPDKVMLYGDALPNSLTSNYCQREFWDHTSQITLYECSLNLNAAGLNKFDFARHSEMMNVIFFDNHVEAVDMTPEGFSRVGVSKWIYE